MTGLGNSGWLKGESRWKPPVSLLLPLIWNSPLWRKKLSVEQRNANINLTHQRRLFEGGEGEATPRWDSHPPMWTGKTKEERRKKLPELNGLLWDWAWQPGESSLRRTALSLPHISAVSQRQEDLFGAGTRGYELFGPLIIYGLRFWNIIFPLNPANT